MGKNSKSVLIFTFSFLIFIFAFIFPQSSLCKRYVNLEIRIEEGIPENSQSFQLIDKMVIQLELDKENYSYQGNFSLSITPSIMEYPLLKLRIELFTIGPDFQRQFLEKIVGRNEIITLDPVRVKQGRAFKVTLLPEIMEKEERENLCEYDLTNKDVWYSDVSVRFQFSYLRNSLADYHWNMNKGYLEREYKNLEKYLDFRYTRKVDYILCPCRIEQITWDERFGTGIDPVKNRVFVLYSQKEKTVDSPAAWSMVFYQYWGYAPAFVVEGLSGCRGLAHYFAKKLKDKGEIVPLSKFKISKDYWSYPARVAFVEASSFIRFLCDEYGTSKFKEFYQEVTDLTFDQVFEKIYNKTLSRIESEWLSFLDKYETLYGDLVYFANIKYNYNDFEIGIPMFEDLLDLAETQGESLNAYQALGNSYYTSGRYEKALSVFQKKSDYFPQDPRGWNIIGNIYFILGEFDSAKRNYNQALALDTNYTDPYISLGKIYLISEEYDSARAYFDLSEMKAPGLENVIDLNLGKAKILKISGDSPEAENKLRKALSFSRRFITQVPERSVPYLKTGESLLDLGFPDSALQYLELAEFLEHRPFYQGGLFLAMGKAYDLTGEKDLALVYLQRVLETPCALSDKREAERILKRLK
jgi:tetratricopeptide (TPR) repeat protein